MKKFKDFLVENILDRSGIHRIDDKPISNFNSHLNTYHHTPDWTESGRAKSTEKPEIGYVKSKGMFGADLHNASPYASPRGTRFTQHWVNGVSHLTFQKSDKSKIDAHRPTLSTFPKSKFRYLENSGEHFSERPGNPIRQTTITNPVNFMKKTGHKVNFVDNLDKHKKELENFNIPHNAEGDFN